MCIAATFFSHLRFHSWRHNLGSNRSFYTMRMGIKHRLLNNGQKMICVRCNRPIRLGAKTVNNKSKLYHEKCFSELYLEFPE
jgi:hypothetical protein